MILPSEAELLRIFIGETDTMDRSGYLWECWDV